MDKKISLLQEEDTKIYNKWVSGIAKREAPASVITVDDIVNRYRNNLEYCAPKNIPYPLNNVLDFIGDIFIKAADLRKLLASAKHYPLYKESEKKYKALKRLNAKMHRIQEIMYSCSEELNILVEKSESRIK